MTLYTVLSTNHEVPMSDKQIIEYQPPIQSTNTIIPHLAVIGVWMKKRLGSIMGWFGKWFRSSKGEPNELNLLQRNGDNGDLSFFEFSDEESATDYHEWKLLFGE